MAAPCALLSLLAYRPALLRAPAGSFQKQGVFSPDLGAFVRLFPGRRFFSTLSQGLSLGGGAVVRFPSMNARLLVVIAEGKRGGVVVKVVVGG